MTSQTCIGALSPLSQSSPLATFGGTAMMHPHRKVPWDRPSASCVSSNNDKQAPVQERAQTPSLLNICRSWWIQRQQAGESSRRQHDRQQAGRESWRIFTDSEALEWASRTRKQGHDGGPPEQHISLKASALPFSPRGVTGPCNSHHCYTMSRDHFASRHLIALL